MDQEEGNIRQLYKNTIVILELSSRPIVHCVNSHCAHQIPSLVLSSTIGVSSIKTD